MFMLELLIVIEVFSLPRGLRGHAAEKIERRTPNLAKIVIHHSLISISRTIPTSACVSSVFVTGISQCSAYRPEVNSFRSHATLLTS